MASKTETLKVNQMQAYDRWQSWEGEVRTAFSCFEGLVESAEALSQRGGLLAAIGCAAIAAEYAAYHHAGIFMSARLERLLLQLGNRIARDLEPAQPTRPWRDGPRHVLHVLTSVHSIGGDSRFVWRWIQADPQRLHSVALTRQQQTPVPAPFANAVKRAGGQLHILDARYPILTHRARALRELARASDLVALDLFPEDIIAPLALARKDGLPPVAFAMQADHQFCVGTSVGDVLVHLRESGSHLSRERRLVNEERFASLPIPLLPSTRQHSRSEAKAQIGLRQDAVAILTIARAVKYTNGTGQSFVNLMLPILEKHPNAVLLAIGPKPSGEWLMGHERTQGRVMALGERSDTPQFYEAADIYIDSYPFCSNTSLLEAGMYELPLVSYRPHANGAAVLCADSPGLQHTLLRAGHPTEFTRLMGDLITDEQRRHSAGESTRAQVLSAHTDEGWLQSLQRLYYHLGNVTPTSFPPSHEDQVLVGEVDVLLHLLYRESPDLYRLIEAYGRPLPWCARVALLGQLLKVTRSFPFGMFLPRRCEAALGNRMGSWRTLPGFSRWLRGSTVSGLEETPVLR